MYTVMLVEDDLALSVQIQEGLGKWGFKADAAENFENIMEDFNRIRPHLIIMDVNLPCFDGFYWCRRIREISKVPVVFLSSRDTNMDIIMGVNTGADDYITKPFSMQVLIAKLQAIIRRTYDYSMAGMEFIEHNGLMLNMGEGHITFGDARTELTRNELKILTLLMNNKGRVVSRESIMQLLWDDDVYVNDNTLTANINRLRSKLADIGQPDFITTKKGQGYVV